LKGERNKQSFSSALKMGKNRTAIRIKQKVQGKKSHNKSEDLARLTEQYNDFTKRLQGLVSALVNQHAAMEQLSKAKFQVAQHLAVLTKDTVLYEATGQTAGADRSSDSVNSYFSVQEEVANKTKMYADKYKQFIVDYAQEWYKTITERVGADLKKAEKIRVELDHYQSKVESLRQSANATMAKGKQVDGKAAEKLTRNEEKLIKIKEASSKFINDLCLLMEEITERSWRDLHPLLIKCSQFETQVSGDEAKALAPLNQVVAALKKIASDQGIKPHARLKDLATVNPHVLSTRSKDDSRNLSIENGFAGMALGGSVTGSITSAVTGDNESQYFPPGSTSAQGIGGFPVRIQSSDMSNGYDLSQSTTNAPSTMSMMNINAAPAPTMDTMAQAFRPTANAPNSGSIYGSTTNSSINRKPSMDSFRSDFSGAPAPPPSAAPPPPPDSFGGGYNAFGAAAPAPTSNAFGTAPQYGSPSPMAPPVTPQTMGGMYGSGYPQQSTPQSAVHGFAQQQSAPQSMGGGFAQSPMAGGMNFSQQPSMYSNQQQPPPSYGMNRNNPCG